MLRNFLAICLLALALPAAAQDADAPIQTLLQAHGEAIAKSSRRTIGPAIDALTESGLPEAQRVLERWQAKEMWQDEATGLFVFAEEVDRDTLRIFDVADGAEIGVVPDDGYDQLKPN
ncbi:urea ABC transporter permease subunit UrtB, partial [Cribrihabitans sp. XS_ASV171]